MRVLDSGRAGWIPYCFGTIMVLAAAWVAPPAAEAQPGCQTTCMGTTGVGKTCSVFICPTYGAMTIASESIVAAVSAGCTLGGLDAMATAMHTPGQGTPATCSFMFSASCCATGFCGAGTGGGAVTCTVNVADGLPVELMEFSVEEDGDEDAEVSEDAGNG